MHLAITLLTIMASVKWGNWQQWRQYHASMYFIATGGLLYEYIVKEYSLWEFHPDWFYGGEMTVIIYALITMPLSIFLFLSHFPEGWFKRVGYILLWSCFYIGAEWVLVVSGRISYDHGWGFLYSFLFDLVMFSVIAIHQYFPVRAYLLSIIIIIFLINLFHVPFRVI